MSNRPAPTSPPLLEVAELGKRFPVRRGLLQRVSGHVHAVTDISFSLAQGETLGLVGESGGGKSTLGKAILRLIEPSSGSIRIDGVDITRISQAAFRPYRRRMQMIFQDPFSSLHPRMPVGSIVGEPLAIHGIAKGKAITERVVALLDRVGLSADAIGKYAHQFSGGQRQRIGIARALSLSPSLIVCDEAVSALDVSVQAQVVNLLMDLQQELGLSYLFIAHDLAVVQKISQRIAVMYLGRIVELAPTAELFSRPLHPYTEALLSAIPDPDPAARRRGRIVLKGDIPSPTSPPPGCPFHTRCSHAFDRCRSELPRLRQASSGHLVACHLRDGAADDKPKTQSSDGLGGPGGIQDAA